MTLFPNALSARSLLRRAASEARRHWMLLGSALLLYGFGVLTSEVGEGETQAFDRAVLMLFRVDGDPTVAVGPHWVFEAARMSRRSAVSPCCFFWSSWWHRSC